MVREREQIMKHLKANLYPEWLIRRHNASERKDDQKEVVERKSIWMRLPYKGELVMRRLRNRLTAALSQSYYAAKLILVESTRKIPIRSVKDKVMPRTRNNIIYQYNCVCSATYVGRTTRRLYQRVREHVPGKHGWAQCNRQAHSGDRM